MDHYIHLRKKRILSQKDIAVSSWSKGFYLLCVKIGRYRGAGNSDRDRTVMARVWQRLSHLFVLSDLRWNTRDEGTENMEGQKI